MVTTVASGPSGLRMATAIRKADVDIDGDGREKRTYPHGLKGIVKASKPCDRRHRSSDLGCQPSLVVTQGFYLVSLYSSPWSRQTRPEPSTNAPMMVGGLFSSARSMRIRRWSSASMAASQPPTLLGCRGYPSASRDRCAPPPKTGVCRFRLSVPFHRPGASSDALRVRFASWPKGAPRRGCASR